MLGFYAIAALPLAGLAFDASVVLDSQTLTATQNPVVITTDQVLAVTQQNLTLTQHNVAVATDHNIELLQQPLTLTENSVTLTTDQVLTPTQQALTFTQNPVALAVDQVLSLTALTPLAFTENSVVVEVQPPPLEQQVLALTQNGVTLTTEVNAELSQQALALTQNNVTLSTGVTATLGSQNLALTQNAVTATTDQVLTLGSLQLLVTLNTVAITTDQVLSLGSLNLYTTLNDFRLWQQIDTAQPFSCSGEPPGTWATITFSDLIYGDNFAIAATPLCSIVPCPPIRKTPPQVWDNINTSTNTSWNKIWT